MEVVFRDIHTVEIRREDPTCLLCDLVFVGRNGERVIFRDILPSGLREIGEVIDSAEQVREGKASQG